MRKLLALGAVVALAACTDAQVTKVQTANDKALAHMQKVVAAVCQQDAKLQPLVVALAVPVSVAVAPASASTAALVNGAVAVDTTVVHPDLVRACAAVAGVPVGAVPAAS